MFASLFRRPAPIINVTVEITPDCVIRPGDLVFISTEALYSADVLRDAVREKLPEGAELLLVCGERTGSLNASRLLEKHLNQFRNKRPCRRNSDPLESAPKVDAAPDEGTAESRVDELGLAASLDPVTTPVTVQKSLPHGDAP